MFHLFFGIIIYSLYFWLLASLIRNNLNEFRGYREVIYTLKPLISYHPNAVIGGSLQDALDWINSQQFTMPHLVSLWNDIWGTSAEILIDVEGGINILLCWSYICLEMRLISGIFAWKWGSAANREQKNGIHSYLKMNKTLWECTLRRRCCGLIVNSEE